MENNLILHTNDEFYDYVLHYMCSNEEISKKINDFTYVSETNLKPFEYVPRYRREELSKEKKIKICSFEDTEFSFDSRFPSKHAFLSAPPEDNVEIAKQIFIIS